MNDSKNSGGATSGDRAGRRVALAVGSLRCGGAERAVTWLSSYLVERGHHVHVITLDAPSSDFFHLREGVERHVAGGYGVSGGPLRRARAYAQRLSRLRAELESCRPEVAISFTDRMSLQVVLAARTSGLPVIVSERTDPRIRRRGSPWHALASLTYRRAALIVPNGKSACRWLGERMDPSRLTWIPNMVEAPPASDSTSSPVPSGPFALYVGRLIESKGVSHLLRAFAACRGADDWRLVLIGDGPLRATLETEARELDLAERVVFAGHVADPWAYLRAASLFAFPSFYEGMPNALLEAMAAGLPSVCYDSQSGTSDLVEDGVTGHLVPLKDEEAFTAALQELISTPALRERMGAAARAASESYRPEVVGAMWEAAIERVTS